MGQYEAKCLVICGFSCAWSSRLFFEQCYGVCFFGLVNLSFEGKCIWIEFTSCNILDLLKVVNGYLGVKVTYFYLSFCGFLWSFRGYFHVRDFLGVVFGGLHGFCVWLLGFSVFHLNEFD